jgi:hypothetical protein
MNSNEINDIRLPNEFKGITFSQYKKADVKKELIQNLKKSKIENSCYWSAEFICAGHYLDLWDIILYYSYKYIHNGNPKLTLYLNMRYNNFISILQNGYSKDILVMRNNEKIRKLFCEIICVLCYSNKKNVISDVKLDKNNSFDLTCMSEKFKAPNVTYIEEILKEDDPKELIIPINELIFTYNSDICAHDTFATIAKINNLTIERNFIFAVLLRSINRFHKIWEGTVNINELNDIELKKTLIKILLAEKVLFKHENLKYAVKNVTKPDLLEDPAFNTGGRPNFK